VEKGARGLINERRVCQGGGGGGVKLNHLNEIRLRREKGSR